MLSLIKSKKVSGGSKKKQEEKSGSGGAKTRENVAERGFDNLTIVDANGLMMLQQQQQLQRQQQLIQQQQHSANLTAPAAGQMPSTNNTANHNIMMKSEPPMTAVAPSTDRPPSRPSSRNSNSGRSRGQPRLGVSSSSSTNQSPYLFEDDPGIMSEVETSSTRFRKEPPRPSSRNSNRPRTSPNQVPRGYSLPNRRQPGDALPPPPSAAEDDPGMMSEAETASTVRSKRSARGSRNSIPMGLKQPPISNNNNLSVSSTLFEEDPGIMSEAETASTSSKRRRDNQKKYTLPVVRTPSKTLERPLGMVFLIYRGETKRALLPNEITSVITVKALFVRSFNKTLTMDYMDSPRVKIYIHDNSKDIFYELEDMNEVRDRTILKVFEADSSGRGPGGLGPSGLPPITNSDEYTAALGPVVGQTVPPGPWGGSSGADSLYVDAAYVKANKQNSRSHRDGINGASSSSTLPRNTFSTAMSMVASTPQPSSLPNDQNHMTGPTNSRLGERSKTLGPGFMRGGRYEMQQQQQQHIQQQQSSAVMSRFSSSDSSRYYPGPANTEEAKARMMHMEAQLSQLTGMVEKALKNKKLATGKKQVSFDKTVTFNDDQPPSILTTSKRHQAQKQHHHHHHQQQQQQQQQQLVQSVETYGQLKRLHRTTRELKQEVRVLRRLTQLQSMAMKDLVQDTYLKLKEACINFSSQNIGGPEASAESLEHWRLAQDEDVFARELTDLIHGIADLESRVEEVRSGVINKKNKILLSDVETMAIALSKCSKSVTQLKQAYPALEANLNLTSGGKKDAPTEFLRKSSDRLDNAWRRCKKLTGTLVTLKRLASVQEQRFHPGGAGAAGNNGSESISLSPTPASGPSTASSNAISNGSSPSSAASSKESALDDLLDALQSYTAPSASPSSSTSSSAAKKENPVKSSGAEVAISSSSSGVIPNIVQTAKVKPQVKTKVPPPVMAKPLITINGGGEQKQQQQQSNGKPTPPCPPPRTVTAVPSSSVSNTGTGKAAPPPPPPRTSSTIKTTDQTQLVNQVEKSPMVAPKPDLLLRREDVLETRHQELLTRQKQLQEQFQRLQEMQEKNKVPTNNNNAKTASSNDDSERGGDSSSTSLPPPDVVNKTETAAASAAATTAATTTTTTATTKQSQQEKEGAEKKLSVDKETV